MVNIEYLDTKRINECGLELLEQIEIYKEALDSLYSRINNISTNTFEWVGNGSDLFINKFNDDYKYYTNLYDVLKQYSYCLVDSSSLIESAIEKVNND